MAIGVTHYFLPLLTRKNIITINDGFADHP